MVQKNITSLTRAKFYNSVPKILEHEQRFLDYLEARVLVCKIRKDRVIYNKAIKSQKIKIKALKILSQF